MIKFFRKIRHTLSYVLKGLSEDAALHRAEYQEGLKVISEKSLALRQL